jgi:hypothetical protein
MAPLTWTGDELTDDQQIEVMAMQIEAWMKWKAHQAARRTPATRARTLPATRSSGRAAAPSRAKEKIVRALRKKA